MVMRFLMAMATLAAVAGGGAEAASPRDVLDAVVGVRTEVPAEARTADTLGRERRGTGVVIDDNGLVLTIGYLVLEAAAVDLEDRDGKRVPAEIVAYDHESGLGLLRATAPLAARGMPLGSAAAVKVGDPLLAIGRIGRVIGGEAKLVDRREFAGYWEYLLGDALFTSPPFPPHSGAALIDRDGRLIGIGSLVVGNAAGDDLPSPGNMFVPIDALKPILAELLTEGHRDAPPRPWLGLTLREVGGRIVVGGTSDGGPAAGAGVEPGDIVVGIGDRAVTALPDLYRAIWAQGAAGVSVPLRVRRGGRMLDLAVGSIDRNRLLKLRQSY